MYTDGIIEKQNERGRDVWQTTIACDRSGERESGSQDNSPGDPGASRSFGSTPALDDDVTLAMLRRSREGGREMDPHSKDAYEILLCRVQADLRCGTI